MQRSKTNILLAGVLGMLFFLPGCSDSGNDKPFPGAAAPEIRGEPIKPQTEPASEVAAVPAESLASPSQATSAASAPDPKGDPASQEYEPNPASVSASTSASRDGAAAPGEEAPASAAVVPPGDPSIEARSGDLAPATTPATATTQARDGAAGISDSNAGIAAAGDSGPAPSPASKNTNENENAPDEAEAKTGASGEFVTVGFDRLAAFNFEVSEELLTGTTNETASAGAPVKSANDQIPNDVKAYDQKRIALKGFMLPLRIESGHVTEMLMMRDQSVCCFGAVPKINEWVSVKMVGQGVKPIMDQAVTLFGTLHVGEMRENGYLVGIYRMDGERMSGPLDN